MKIKITFKIKIKKKPQQIFKLPKEHSDLLRSVKSRIAVFFSKNEELTLTILEVKEYIYACERL